MKEKNSKKKSNVGAWYYLGCVFVIYLLVAVMRQDIFLSAIQFFLNLAVSILPVFALVIMLMTVTTIFMTPHVVERHVQRSGVGKWLFMVVGGILSSGPIFMWYPFLSDIKDKGMGHGPLATFLYNRAIKIPLLPVAVYYFGWRFVLVLTLVMIAVSVAQGIIIDRVMPCES